MELKGEQTIVLSREAVWQALNDPHILKQCIPGCESFESLGDNQFKVTMQVTVGPIRAKFTGKLILSEIDPPLSYKISFDGTGGVAGFGKGQATVVLNEIKEGTRLTYGVNAQVGGRLAQVGTRIVDSVAKKMADIFFEKLNTLLVPPHAAPTFVSESKESQNPSHSPFKQTLWIAGTIIIALAAIYFFSK